MPTFKRQPLHLVALMAATSLVRGQMTATNTSTGPITSSMTPNLRIVELYSFPSVWNTTYTTDTYTVTHCDAVGDSGTGNIDCTWDIAPYAFFVYEPITTTTFTDPAAYSSFSSSIQYPLVHDHRGYVQYTPGHNSITMYSSADPNAAVAPLSCCNDLIANPDIIMSYLIPTDTTACSACPTILIDYLGPFVDGGLLEMPPGSHFGDETWKPHITGSQCYSVITGLATTKTPVVLALKTADEPGTVPTTGPGAGPTGDPGPSLTQPTIPTIPVLPTVPSLPTVQPPAPTNTNPPQQSPSPAPSPSGNPNPPQPSPNPPQPSPNPPRPSPNLPQPSPNPNPTTQPQAPGNTQVAPPPQNSPSPAPIVNPNPIPNPPVIVTATNAVTIPTIVNGQPTSLIIATSVATFDTTINGTPTQTVSSFTSTFAISASTGETTINTVVNEVPTQIVSTFTSNEFIPADAPVTTGATVYTTEINGVLTTITQTSTSTLTGPSLPPIYEGSGSQLSASKMVLGSILGVFIMLTFNL